MFLTFVVSHFKRNATIILSLIIVGLILFGFVFYIDPKRDIPIENGIILSPADGKIISIDTIKSDGIPFTEKNGKVIYLPELKGIIEGNYTMVSIFMGPFDVHVNRSPISGEVVDVIYIQGAHFPAFGEVITENERNIVIIEGEIRTITIQIAGTLGRRIDCYVKKGDVLEMGERIGKIKLGSQAVVIFSSKYSTSVNIGDKVKAGESIIANLN
jgi:phosphatidylserine decarboxylase